MSPFIVAVSSTHHFQCQTLGTAHCVLHGIKRGRKFCALTKWLFGISRLSTVLPQAILLVCFVSLQQLCYVPVWSDIGMANVGVTLDASATLSMMAGANFSASHQTNRFCYWPQRHLCLLFSLLQSLIVH